jgi:hypothetical protein
MAGRELLGYLMGVLFAAVFMVMMALAWVGIDKGFGWEVAAGLLLFSLFMRVNLFMLAGSYLFAHKVWGFPLEQAVVFALPALMYVTPSVALPLFGVISRPFSHS